MSPHQLRERTRQLLLQRQILSVRRVSGGARIPSRLLLLLLFLRLLLVHASALLRLPLLLPLISPSAARTCISVGAFFSACCWCALSRLTLPVTVPATLSAICTQRPAHTLAPDLLENREDVLRQAVSRMHASTRQNVAADHESWRSTP